MDRRILKRRPVSLISSTRTSLLVKQSSHKRAQLLVQHTNIRSAHISGVTRGTGGTFDTAPWAPLRGAPDVDSGGLFVLPTIDVDISGSRRDINIQIRDTIVIAPGSRKEHLIINSRSKNKKRSSAKFGGHWQSAPRATKTHATPLAHTGQFLNYVSTLQVTDRHRLDNLTCFLRSTSSASYVIDLSK